MPAHVPPHEPAAGGGSRQRPLRPLLPAAAACCLLFAFLPLASSAQSRFVDAGDKAYENLAYAKAIVNYERAAENAVPDSSYARKLAKSYLNVRDFHQAEVWYARAVAKPDAKPIDCYDYAQALRANGKYGEADKWLRTYEQRNASDSRGKRQACASSYAAPLRERPLREQTAPLTEITLAVSDLTYSPNGHSNGHGLNGHGPKGGYSKNGGGH